jgi:N-terminal domain of anti-restriction factor ArdC
MPVKTDRFDILQHITDQIVSSIERGVGDFRLPWHRSAGNILRPVNVASKKAYRGINVVALWAYAEEFGYSSGVRLDVATVLFLLLFLFWRSRNFRERGSGRGDLWASAFSASWFRGCSELDLLPS